MKLSNNDPFWWKMVNKVLILSAHQIKKKIKNETHTQQKTTTKQIQQAKRMPIKLPIKEN